MDRARWPYLPNYAVPPGAILCERLEDLGMTQSELARRMGRSEAKISQIINGSRSITPETALQLERTVGTSAETWLSLQAGYDANRARLAGRDRLLREEGAVAARFPYAEMARRGWVPDTRRPIERIEQLLAYMGVASLLAEGGKPAPAMFRVARCGEPSQCALAAWLRWGQIEGREATMASFSQRSLQRALPELRGLTQQDPTRCVDHLRTVLAGCGVALVIVPALKGTHVQGATQWLARDRAVVQLSGRCKWADVFWFDLFHELGHLLLHDKAGEVFVRFTDERDNDERETEADQFAQDILIPAQQWQRLLDLAPYNAARIRRFATESAVGAGVVVGRLQHEREVPRNRFNDLRVLCNWGAT